MQAKIFQAIQALNEVEVKGERNHDLLLFALQQLKQVQTQLLEGIHHEQDDPA